MAGQEVQQLARAEAAAMLKDALDLFVKATNTLTEQMVAQIDALERGEDPPGFVGPTTARQDDTPPDEHRCPSLPASASTWALFTCPHGAQYRRYPRNVAAGEPARWERIDV
jgi:hypothetical protein